MTQSSIAASSQPLANPGVLAVLDAKRPAPRPNGAADAYTVNIALKQMTVTLHVSRAPNQEGRVVLGVSGLGSPARPTVQSRGEAERVVRLHVQSGLLAESFDRLRGRAGADHFSLPTHDLSSDPVVERLGHALYAAGRGGEALQGAFVEATCLAIVLRLLSLRSERAPAPARARRSGLPKWRLKRALDYIDVHLAEPFTLADLAAFTGLSRMYFAAQFRAATGVRPHEYLLRRRIQRAQELLSRPGLAVVEVALSVGFQTQAHFTTVFKRFVGETPYQWRRQNRQGV